jgi:c-di-GMP-binding flagellar brake protein YcgR
MRIADISLTGALLESHGEIPERQLLDLELTLDGATHVRVSARVVRVQHPQWGRVAGIGVAFLRFEGDSRENLARYIDADPVRSGVPEDADAARAEVPAW